MYGRGRQACLTTLEVIIVSQLKEKLSKYLSRHMKGPRNESGRSLRNCQLGLSVWKRRRLSPLKLCESSSPSNTLANRCMNNHVTDDCVYEVRPFEADVLCRFLANEYCDKAEVAQNERVKYLLDYFGRENLRVQTVIVEFSYVDGNYLDDFAAYYVKCLQHYRKHCKRLHFFSMNISPSEFRDILRGTISLESPEVETLRDSYVGFVVARPLPFAIIGRTVVKTYDDDGERRRYTCVRDYETHLFGIPLTIKNSLAFQEQDNVVAACATVALWCAFQRLSKIFGVSAPRPAMITQAATAFRHPVRGIPSYGLMSEQMLDAILHVGLQPELLDFEENPEMDVVAFAYGYLVMGLPVILGVKVFDPNNKYEGMHAVTAVGYSIKNRPVRTTDVGEPRMNSLRIDALYVHDDQVGPFSRFEVKPNSTVGHCPEFECTPAGDKGTYRMIPVQAIVPVYGKIRVCYRDIRKIVDFLDAVFFAFDIEENESTELDASLTTTNDYKKLLLKSWGGSADILELILCTNHPRFIWRIVYRTDEVDIVEVLADATDMARSCPYQIVWHQDAYRSFFAEEVFDEASTIQEMIQQISVPTPFQWADLLLRSVQNGIAWRKGYGPPTGEQHEQCEL